MTRRVEQIPFRSNLHFGASLNNEKILKVRKLDKIYFFLLLDRAVFFQFLPEKIHWSGKDPICIYFIPLDFDKINQNSKNKTENLTENDFEMQTINHSLFFNIFLDLAPKQLNASNFILSHTIPRLVII